MANKEIGRIGQRRYGGTIYEEFLHELRGTRGIEVYREMSENDDVVGAILFAIEMLVRQCDWNVEPGGDAAKDKEAAEFVESCMHDMQDTWTDTISEILSFLTYGWSFHEIVYKRRMGNTKNPTTKSKYTDGLIGWKKLPIRAQETLYRCEYSLPYFPTQFVSAYSRAHYHPKYPNLPERALPGVLQGLSQCRYPQSPGFVS